MTGPAHAFGPMLEVLTWVGFIPGIPRLIPGWIMARRRCQWSTTSAEVFEAGGYKGYRWSDGENTQHLSLHSTAETLELVAGARVELHYDQCHPERWILEPARKENPSLPIGWMLTWVGILCTLAGIILLMF